MPVSDFFQSEPEAGKPATERTEVRLVYDNAYLYIGVLCYDSNPEKLIATNLSRDADQGANDGVGIFLDTYNDKSTGLYFSSNPLGARYDGEISGNDNLNNNFNTFWDVACRRIPEGYSMEFRIPFSVMRFEPKPVVTMGFKVVRLIKRKNELVFYPAFDPTVQNPFGKVSLATEIVFHDLKSSRPLYISPYVAGNFTHEKKLNDPGTAYIASNEYITRKHFFTNETLDKIASSAGLDIKYGLSKNLTLDITANTDFAQAEVDNRIINLTKYEINLPEKRSFFLESQNNLSFSFGPNGTLFRSRSIGMQDGVLVPIVGGVRMTGKVKDWQMGVLNMQTAPVESDSIEAQNHTAVRFRKFIGSKGSFVGGIFTNRLSTASSAISNQTAGQDFVWKMDEKHFLAGGLAQTYDATVQGAVNRNLYANAVFAYSPQTGFAHLTLVDFIQDKFNAVMGFVPENDMAQVATNNGYNLKIKNSNSLNYLSIRANSSFRWKLQSGLVETFRQDLVTELTFKNGASIFVKPAEYLQDRIFSDWELSEGLVIPMDFYTAINSEVYYNAPANKTFWFGAGGVYGGFYGGRQFRVYPSVSYSVNKHLRFDLNYEYVHITFPGHYAGDRANPVYQSHLVSGNVLVAFSTKTTVKLLAQYDNLSHSFGSNLRFRYNPREGTDLYLVFNTGLNSGLSLSTPEKPLLARQAIVLKFVRTFTR